MFIWLINAVCWDGKAFMGSRGREEAAVALSAVAVVLFEEKGAVLLLPLLVPLAFELAVCALQRKAALMPAHLSAGHLLLVRLLLSRAEWHFMEKYRLAFI